MRIISPKVQSLLPEHVGCFKWLQCSNRHRFLIMVRYYHSYNCPKCGRHGWFDFVFKTAVLCA